MKMSEMNPVGTRLQLGTIEFTAEKIVHFARQFDPQPFHVDAEAAKDYVFGGLCASGWQSAAGWMKALLAYWGQECARLEREGIAPPKLGPSPGFRKMQWLRPIYAGDSITYYTTLLNSRELASRPGVWLNSTLNEGVNQNGDTVIRFESNVLEFT